MSGRTSRPLINMADDLDNISGGTPNGGADVNAVTDLISADWLSGPSRLDRRLENLVSDTFGERKAHPEPWKAPGL